MRHEPTITSAELLAIRQEFNLTQREFGDLLGVSREAVWKWENNERVAKGTSAKLPRLYLKLYRLGVPIAEMLSRDEENIWLERHIRT